MKRWQIGGAGGTVMAELELEAQDANAIKALRVGFLDVFAAHHAHRKQAARADLDELAAGLARSLGEGGVPADGDLRKAAETLADATNAWPTTKRFLQALTDAQPVARRPQVRAPDHWRWQLGKKPPPGVDPAAWWLAGTRQEEQAKQFFHSDLQARELAACACREGWATTLYWFVVDRGHLPSEREEAHLVDRATATNKLAQLDGTKTLSVLKLRQAMLDYAARQMGCESVRLVAA